ncbi:MAG: 3-dehydroquinate synthase [Burkholderiales bacterium]|jgi:3-dehydroquinate synthase|nr:3-dehydroquinate synthase [Burkholderiales bacterium]
MEQKTSSTLQVDLGARSYPIHIGTGVFAEAGRLLHTVYSGQRVFVVSNPVVAAHHLVALQQGLSAAGITSEVWQMPDGERAKNWEELYQILGWLLESRAERHTPLIALGGGVVGDLAGLAAALYQRGMPLIQAPTSLLAQVDSSVGGKTAVNHPLGKNMIGAFYQPQQVWIDTNTLATLPPREYISGLAEVVKYGAIRDRNFFDWLEKNTQALLARDPVAVNHAIHQSCRAKAMIVAADERETGERALLNLGHTFGHAIETALGYGQWLHGEAVAVGMVLAGRLSTMACGFEKSEQQRLEQLLATFGLPLTFPNIPPETWMTLMARDKKVSGGKMRFVLLERLGRAVVRQDIEEAALMQVLITSS